MPSIWTAWVSHPLPVAALVTAVAAIAAVATVAVGTVVAVTVAIAAVTAAASAVAARIRDKIRNDNPDCAPRFKGVTAHYISLQTIVVGVSPHHSMT